MKRQAKEDRHGALPPYVPYGTFRRFIQDMRKNFSSTLPRRLDASSITLVSGALQWQIIHALRFLGMVDQTGLTTERFVRMAKAETAEFKQALHEALVSSYSPLLGNLDLAKATPREVRGKFVNSGATGETLRKCVAFFVAASKEAGLRVPPRIRPFAGSGRSGRKAVRSSPQEMTVADPDQSNSTQPANGNVPPDWHEWLKEKFPDFDPTWSNELKAKWLEDFEQLIRILGRGQMVPPQSDNN
jgi:hypothetical protein